MSRIKLHADQQLIRDPLEFTFIQTARGGRIYSSWNEHVASIPGVALQSYIAFGSSLVLLLGLGMRIVTAIGSLDVVGPGSLGLLFFAECTSIYLVQVNWERLAWQASRVDTLRIFPTLLSAAGFLLLFKPFGGFIFASSSTLFVGLVLCEVLRFGSARLHRYRLRSLLPP